MISFEIPGEPVAKGRPRATRQGHFFTPEKTVRYENKVALFAAEAMDGRPPIEGPLALEFTAVFSWPASWSAKKRAACPGKVSKPDGDNLQKAVSDAMNGIVYRDDAQIISWSGSKVYGDRPGLRVSIRPYSERAAPPQGIAAPEGLACATREPADANPAPSHL